jgi:hypothetical protein
VTSPSSSEVKNGGGIPTGDENATTFTVADSNMATLQTANDVKCHGIRGDCVLNEQSHLSPMLTTSLFQVWQGFPRPNISSFQLRQSSS